MLHRSSITAIWHARFILALRSLDASSRNASTSQFALETNVDAEGKTSLRFAVVSAIVGNMGATLSADEDDGSQSPRDGVSDRANMQHNTEFDAPPLDPERAALRDGLEAGNSSTYISEAVASVDNPVEFAPVPF